MRSARLRDEPGSAVSLGRASPLPALYFKLRKTSLLETVRWVSVTVIKHRDQKQLEDERIYFTFHCGLSLKATTTTTTTTTTKQ